MSHYIMFITINVATLVASATWLPDWVTAFLLVSVCCCVAIPVAALIVLDPYYKVYRAIAAVYILVPDIRLGTWNMLAHSLLFPTTILAIFHAVVGLDLDLLPGGVLGGLLITNAAVGQYLSYRVAKAVDEIR